MNNTAIAAAQPGATLWDDKVKGLHLRAFANRKMFYLVYRPKNAPGQRRPKLGAFGDITLSQARKLAGDMLDEVRAGRDPVAARAEGRAALTMRQLAAKYLRFARSNPKRKKTRRGIRDDLRQLKSYVLPDWGRRLVRDIRTEDVEILHQSMRATPYQANRTRALLSRMFNLAEKWGLRPKHTNPCYQIDRFPEKKRRRHMRGEEAPIVAFLLEQYESRYPRPVLFIYLLILTGARPDEIARATGAYLDGNKLILEEHKTDDTGEPRVIYLPPRVMRLLEDAEHRSPTETLTGIKSPRALWDKIRIEAGCPDLRLYDLRRTFASAALRAGYTLDQIGELLGHTSGTTSKRYAWLMDEFRQEAAGKTAKVLEDMMAPTKLEAPLLGLPSKP